MLRCLAAAAVAGGLVLPAAPAHAKPDPIRAFTVTVKSDQLRASALVPGRPGRQAQLQQFADGRWVTVAKTRTKRTQGTPRARWRVAIEDLRLASGQRRAQVGPLTPLTRLRAKAGTSTSKPKKVSLQYSQPMMPRVVSGFISGQTRAENGIRQWYGDVRFEYHSNADDTRALYKLTAANLTWQVEATQPNCQIEGTGTFTAADLKGEGWIEVPDRDSRARKQYNFALSGSVPVPVKVTCGNNVTMFQDDFTPVLNTLDCPSSGQAPSLYTSQPWTDRKPPYVFYNQVGVSRSGFCNTVLEDLGVFQKWDLTGSELFEFELDLAPIAAPRGKN